MQVLDQVENQHSKICKQASFDLGEKDWRSDRGQQKNWQKTWSDVSEVGKIEKKMTETRLMKLIRDDSTDM